MKLNCDLGESYGQWKMADDDKIMPFVDMASIACGFHAGDPLVMERAIKFAKIHKVDIGAHPSYPDLQGFGRRSMNLQHSELVALMHYQIAALEGMAKCQGTDITYVKPHGALYNDMMANEEVLKTVLHALASYHKPLPLVIQATLNWQLCQQMADKLAVKVMFEAFADRRYQDDGKLVPRSQPGAVLNHEQMLEQVQSLFEHGQVRSLSGSMITIKADTLCVHGDNDEALEGVKSIRTLISGQ